MAGYHLVQVRVLVLVDQVARTGEAPPQICRNRVAMTRRKDGSRWLVGDPKSC